LLCVRPILAVLLLAAAICGCSSAGPLGEYKAARTLHLAPDGRLVVTDLASGKHDGTVTAVDVASGRRTRAHASAAVDPQQRTGTRRPCRAQRSGHAPTGPSAR
jgi:hypothetical protein